MALRSWHQIWPHAQVGEQASTQHMRALRVAVYHDLGAEKFPLYEKLTALSARGKRVVYTDRMRRFVRRNPSLVRLAATLRGQPSEDIAL